MTDSERIRKILGISRAEFSRRYRIPLRTLEAWDAGTNTPPAYVMELLERVVKEERAKEGKRGEWQRMSELSEEEDDRYKCSRCGNVVHHKDRISLYTFNSWCGRCGSDNNRI